MVTGEPVAVMGGGGRRAVLANPYYMWNSARMGYLSIQAHGGPQNEGQRVRE